MKRSITAPPRRRPRLAARVIVTLSRPDPVDTIARRMPTRTAQATAAAVDAFATHLRVERHASPHTLRAYVSDVRQFLETAGADGLVAVGPDAIRRWLRTLDGDNERSSIARKLSAVRGFFRFCTRTKRLAHDPTTGIATPKVRRTLPTHLSLDDVDRLLSVPRDDTLLARRDRAILELLYSSGLRVSELTGLDWERLDVESGAVRGLGKGRKERVVPVGRQALRAQIGRASCRERVKEPGVAAGGREVKQRT